MKLLILKFFTRGLSILFFTYHSMYMFQIPTRSSCHFGKHPHNISSNKSFNLFLKGVDYSKIKDNTLCSGNLPSSEWKILFTTNIVVFIFHRFKRVLSGLGRRRRSQRGRRPSPRVFGESSLSAARNPFIDDEAEVFYFHIYHMRVYRKRVY